MTAPMVDYKIHWLKMMSVPESRAVVGRHDGINGRDRSTAFLLSKIFPNWSIARDSGTKGFLLSSPNNQSAKFSRFLRRAFGTGRFAFFGSAGPAGYDRTQSKDG